MTMFALVPLLLGLLCAVGARVVARSVAPRIAAITLTILALSVSLATGMMFCAAGYLAVASLAPWAHPRDWTHDVLRQSISVPPTLGVAAGVTSAVLILNALTHVVRLARRHRRVSVAVRSMPVVAGLVVTDTDTPQAYSVPGAHPRIVVSRGMLRRLEPAHHRALLEHERSHLRHRHHRYTQLAGLAAAGNPLVRPVATAVAVAVERWADADAADVLGDRVLVAHAIGAAALAMPRSPAATLGIGEHSTVERVRCLLSPPRHRAGHAAALLVIVVACWTCSVIATKQIYNTIELVERMRP